MCLLRNVGVGLFSTGSRRQCWVLICPETGNALHHVGLGFLEDLLKLFSIVMTHVLPPLCPLFLGCLQFAEKNKNINRFSASEEDNNKSIQHENKIRQFMVTGVECYDISMMLMGEIENHQSFTKSKFKTI